MIDEASRNKQTLFTICSRKNAEQTDDFVGIKYVDGKLKVSFPASYKISNDEAELRKDILNLIDCLTSYSSAYDSKLPDSKNIDLKDDVQFPIHAYINIINYFMNYGYYKENEVIYNTSKSGKIDWNRTIKSIKPVVSGNNVVYLKQIRRRLISNNNALITLIHKYCVRESFDKLGCIFTDFIPEESEINFDKDMFLSVINTKLTETFNEKTILLLNNMKAMVLYLGNNKNNSNFYVGTNRFEYVWEKLIDEIYGIKNKEQYFPTFKWHIRKNDKTYDGGSVLMPDTIMITKNKDNQEEYYILDAKYYKYDEKKSISSLPSISSVNKQITYGEYLEYNKNYKKENIYNAFIMPGDLSGTSTHVENIGYAEGNWKSEKDMENRPYYQIQGIILDIKDVMQRHTLKNEAIKQMALTIKKGYVYNKV